MSFAATMPQLWNGIIESRWSLVKVFAGSILMILSAQWIIPLQPVPITLQTFMAMLLGVTLGKRAGACSVLLYLSYIGLGLPAGAGGVINPLLLVGPKAGYYFGMVVQAYLVGYFIEKREAISQARALGMLGLICFIQLSLGALVLSAFFGLKVAFYAGFLPFVPGEILKSAIVIRHR